MSSYREDAKSARMWLVEIGIELFGAALSNDKKTQAVHDRVALMVLLSQLEDDSVLRIRCTPHVFRFDCLH
jgi:hypothetical protein